MFRVGTQYRRHGKLFHVRAIVDDDQVVVRAWSHKLGWRYSVEPMFVLDAALTNGWIELVKVPADNPS